MTKPTPVHLAAKLAGGSASGKAMLQVIPADRIKVEESTTLKYLRLRSGDYQAHSRVLAVTDDGKEIELTVDELPENET